MWIAWICGNLFVAYVAVNLLGVGGAWMKELFRRLKPPKDD